MWTGMVSDARSDQVYSIKVVNEFPHDPTAFTQILALHKMDDSYFGEGLTLLGEKSTTATAIPNLSCEWKSFGSFYFIVPQVELDELEGSSMLATTIVLGRCSRVMISTDINHLAWLACLQVVDGNSYQFCIQPPDAKLCKRESTK
ncbi:hypothetical protein Vadar_032638 [Vaccinium darrowii]|uniref:Uncharacterized protein n=1 Tax=Vaccinium darrowii TaxID=229202 RepID=A0ACB7YI51_9ERIC|nr:hypothetical protein Vadar_032638 [Vaccinium darrowii]